jgi:hypothetical protein
MINQQPIVIPAQAGIQVFQGLEWTPAFEGVTATAQYCYFEIGSIQTQPDCLPKMIHLLTTHFGVVILSKCFITVYAES